MKPAEVKLWMQRNDKTEIDIAAGTRIHPTTIARYLKTGRGQPATISTIERFIKDYEQAQSIAPKKAADG